MPAIAVIVGLLVATPLLWRGYETARDRRRGAGAFQLALAATLLFGALAGIDPREDLVNGLVLLAILWIVVRVVMTADRRRIADAERERLAEERAAAELATSQAIGRRAVANVVVVHSVKDYFDGYWPHEDKKHELYRADRIPERRMGKGCRSCDTEWVIAIADFQSTGDIKALRALEKAKAPPPPPKAVPVKPAVPAPAAAATAPKPAT